MNCFQLREVINFIAAGSTPCVLFSPPATSTYATCSSRLCRARQRRPRPVVSVCYALCRASVETPRESHITNAGESASNGCCFAASTSAGADPAPAKASVKPLSTERKERFLVMVPPNSPQKRTGGRCRGPALKRLALLENPCQRRSEDFVPPAA